MFAEVEPKSSSLMLSPLDLIMTVRYVTDCDRCAIPQSAVAEDFFVLSNGIAGDILQKFVNYHVKLAVFGIPNTPASRFGSLYMRVTTADTFFFVGTEDEAVAKLAVVSRY